MRLGEFPRWMSNEMTSLVQGLSGKRRLLVKFQGGCEKYQTSNKLDPVTLDSIPVTEEAKVPTIYAMHDDPVDL